MCDHIKYRTGSCCSLHAVKGSFLRTFLVLGSGVVVVCLPSLCKALGSILSTTKQSDEMGKMLLDRIQGTLIHREPFCSSQALYISPKVTLR